MTWSMRWALCASLICAVPAMAQVKMEHLLGTYSTIEDGCRDEVTQDFEIRRGIVEGPNLLCILGAPKEASAGQEAYEAKCREKGEVRLGTVTFDLSGKPERMRITLPEREDWITLYSCR
jgi:hypothetical protein